MRDLLAVLILVTATSCYQSAAARDASQRAERAAPSAEETKAPSAITFEDVLEIARSKSADAKNRIEKAGIESNDAFDRLLAARILSLWNEQQNTFFSATPALLDSNCLDVEGLRQRYREPIEPTLLLFEIRVGANGRPIRVESIRGTTNRELQDAVTHVLMESRFLPVKEGDQYLDGTLTAQCRIEVR